MDGGRGREYVVAATDHRDYREERHNELCFCFHNSCGVIHCLQ